MTDFVISNNLVVFGMSTFTGGQTFDGQAIIDITDTEAFLVRKNNDGGDVFTVDTATDPTLVIVTGNIIGANANGPAFLNEAASSSNPTLIPRRADLTTGISGTDGEGTPFLHLVTDGATRMSMSAAAVTFTLTDRIQLNASLRIDGLVDQTQLRVQGHSTQTSDLVVFEQSDGTDLFTITNAGLATLNGSIVVGATNPASSGSIRLPNAGDIIFRNSANSGDLSALSIGPTNFLEIGLSGTPWPRFDVYSAQTIIHGIVSNEADSTLAFQVKSLTPVETIFRVDTVNDEVTVKSTVVIGDDETAGFGLTIGDNHQGHSPLWIVGSFTSDGAQGFSAVSAWNMGLTGFAGDTVLAGLHVNNFITTQGNTDVIANVSQLFLAEPQITVGTGDTITNAQTFLIDGAPTEGASNFAMRVVSGLSQFGGTVQAATALGPAFLNETSSATNPTLIPNRADLTTGVAAATGEGTTLYLITGGTHRVEFNDTTMIVSVDTVINSRLDILGDGTDQVTLLVRGFNGQTLDVLQVKAAIPTIVDVLTVDQSGVTTLGEGLPSPIDALILDSAALTGDGQRDSHAILLTGKGFETATPHDIDWKAFVNVTANDGTGSIWTLQTRIDAAGFVDQLTIAEGGDLTLLGNLAVSGAGPHSIAGVTFGAVQLLIGSTFTSDGASDIAAGLFHTPAIVGAPGDTSALTGTTLTAGITTQTATESIANIAQLQINEPFITDNLTGSITNAQTLLITGAPTEGNANWALRIVSGDVKFGGDIFEIGTGGGDIDILFRGCSTFFMGTLASPEAITFGLGSVNSLNNSILTLNGSPATVEFRLRSTTGDFMEVRRVNANFALSSGSSVTVASLIPAGSFVVGITARVTTAVTGPTGFDIGDGVDVDRWGNSIAVGLGTTVDITDFTATELSLFPTANDIVITSDGVDFTGGAVRLVVHYMSLSAPTS